MMSVLRSLGSTMLVVAAAITLLTTTVTAQITPDYQTSSYRVDVSPAPAQTSTGTWVNMTGGDDRVDYVPLGFNFVFWNRTYNSVNVSANGNIQFRTAVSTSAPALFGQNVATMNPIIAFFYIDLVPTAADSRSYQITGSAPNRQFILRYTNVPLYPIVVTEPTLTGEIILQEGTNVITTRYYSVPYKFVTTTPKTVEIGIQSMANYIGPYQPPIEYVAMWNDRNMTVESAAILTGKQIVYTPLNSAPAGPEPPITCQANPIDNTNFYDMTILAAPAFVDIPEMNNMTVADDRVDYVPLGFTFSFFGRDFNSVNISTNGNAQFVTAVSGSTNAFFGASSTSYNPAIAFFHADMKPAEPNQRTWSLTGTAPNRKFTIRYNDVAYCCTAAPGNGVIVDVVMHETTNIIDMIYYRVPVGTRLMEIGLQGTNSSDWIAYWNDVAFPTQCISALQGKQLRFAPEGSVVTPSTGTSPVRSSSSTGGAPATSSSTAPATPSSAAPATPSSTALPIVPSTAGETIDPTSTAGEQPKDEDLNGVASINAMIAFVIVAISMIVAM